MRVVNSTFISLDGVINKMEAWHFDYISDETSEITLDQLKAADAMLMGRTTYEIYAGAWPNRDGDYPELINAVPKYVASTTLKDPEWNNTTVIDGDVVEFVRKLREAPGGDILMHGFGPVAGELMKNGLLDVLHLWVHPKLAGVGESGDLLLRQGVNNALTLTGNRALSNGIVMLSYEAA
ncbi:dihydrofolate reductase family protein [Tenggerimyces flavus]|uniref:Dihydrofolate reductase family protein n=1 Tax=Tenggerimyces flavus TaxID=1708749 RepID=A0ABV7YER5_9ACTN|nr:dihydrofolate reductase family protein [Tenggerimyces flavus]MBM7789319.1 dihydrofolate reductase [Tenggerimyces flavus]